MARVDRLVVAPVDGEDQFELLQVGLDRRAHVGVLELAGEVGAVVAHRPVHLAQGGGGRGACLEFGEALAQVGPQLGRHPPLDEGPAHGRRVGLELGELGDVLVGQGIGDGGQQLGDLHQRPLDAAQRPPEGGGVALAVGGQAKEALGAEARGDAAHGGRDPGIAGEAAGQAVVFAGAGHHATKSSSSMKPAMTSRPRPQKPGSVASSPKGASSSLCLSVPPARSMAKYFA